MKKTALTVIPLLLLLITPVNALATLITYAGSGYFSYTTTANTTNTSGISIAMQISNQPTDWITGQPIQIDQSFVGQYSFDIANWFMNISGFGNYSGKSGSIFVDKGIHLDNGQVVVGDAMWFLNYEPMTEPHNGSGPFWGQAVGSGDQLNDFNQLILPHQLTLNLNGWGQALFGVDYYLPFVGGDINVSAVPEPSSLMLLGSVFAGFTWFIARRKRK